MKVLMQGRLELKAGGGGDKIQIENTASELRKLGVTVDICFTPCADYAKYDLIHFFQLDWTPDPAMYAQQVKQAGKPLIFSPIHHNINEVKRFDDTYVFDFRRLTKYLFKDQFKRDTFKNVYKSLFNHAKVYPTLYSVVTGLKKIHARALTCTDLVFVQTTLEAQDLMTEYHVTVPWEVIPNGVGASFLEYHKNKAILKMQPLTIKGIATLQNYILCVGRIEARKNQLSIIKAVNQLRLEDHQDYQLVFVGRKSTKKHLEYILRFNWALKKYPWLHYIAEVPYESIAYVYGRAKVCVSASWFETTGLTPLEALFCGTNAVAAGARAKEYLGDMVSYCDPWSIPSIKTAIRKEFYAAPPVLADHLVAEFTWENAAKKTLVAYTNLLGLKA